MKIAKLILFVTLCAAIPVVNFGAANALDDSFELDRLPAYFAVLFLFAVVVWLSCLAIARVFRGEALLLGAVLGGTFTLLLSCSTAIVELIDKLRPVQSLFEFSLVALMLLLLSWGAAYFLHRNQSLITILTVAAFAWIAVDVVTFAQRASARAASASDVMPDADSGTVRFSGAFELPATLPDARSLPNIYFILPDAMFGRERFIERRLDDRFFGELEARGFRFVEDAKTNAPVTSFSVPHFFGMGYFLEDGEKVSAQRWSAIQESVQQGGRVVPALKQLGYQIVQVYDRWIYARCHRFAERCIQSETLLSAQDFIMLRRLPLRRLESALGRPIFGKPIFLAERPGMVEFDDVIEMIPPPESTPSFVWMHLGLPHSPVRFTADCSLRLVENTTLQGHLDQNVCAGKALVKITDAILARDPDAIIVIQSDHGPIIDPPSIPTTENLPEEFIRESSSIISGFRMPERCQGFLRGGLTSANAMRVVLACVSGSSPQLIPDRRFLVFYLTWPEGGRVREITHD